MITVCLLNWKRPRNLRRIIDRLGEQTLRPTIFLWNNSPETFEHPAVDWQVDSSRNMLCPPRWWMAARARTPWVASLDDDLLPADRRVLADAVTVADAQPAERAIGPFGVNLRPGRPYFPHDNVRCPPCDTPVDLVLGRCLIVRAGALRRALRLADLNAYYDHGRGDDMAVCGALAGGRRRRHLVPGMFRGRFRELPVGREGLEHHPSHAGGREAARKHWFPEHGSKRCQAPFAGTARGVLRTKGA